jgi:hypothetical protein
MKQYSLQDEECEWYDVHRRGYHGTRRLLGLERQQRKLDPETRRGWSPDSEAPLDTQTGVRQTIEGERSLRRYSLEHQRRIDISATTPGDGEARLAQPEA